MKNCVVNFVVLLAGVCSARNLENNFRRLQKMADVTNLNDLYRSSTTLYIFNRECRNYDDAKHICEINGGHLAIVNSDAEADLLAAIFQRYPPESLQCESELYLGAHYVDRESYMGIEIGGDFITFEGETLQEAGYAKWADGEPNNLTYGSGGEKCVTFFRNKRMNDLHCGNFRPFVCEIPGYFYNSESNSRYMLHMNRYRAGRAARVCRSHGGHLASIDSSAEALLIKQFITDIYKENTNVLVDYHFDHVEVLSPSEPVSSELDATNNQEPIYIANDCIAIDTKGNPVTVSCTQENYFICEIDSDDYKNITKI